MSTIVIESLDHEGRGVGHVDGKTIFVEGALPGEIVEYTSYKRKARYEFAELITPIRVSSQREMPRCKHFGYCGGCSMQHLNIQGQAAVKQRVLEDALWHIARIRPDEVLSPIKSSDWGYRQRARFSIRNVEKKGGVLVGFHEKRSSYVAVMDSCPILPPKVSRLIPALKSLVSGLSNNNRIPQIEIACGDDQTVLVLRHLELLSEIDKDALRRFSDQHAIVWYLQPKGPDTAVLFYPEHARPLSYQLPEFSLSLEFSPTEFTQVNHGVNRLLVNRAMALLAPQSGERIADMFCGLGNFSFPIARMGAYVIGIEGSNALVARATKNAIKNGLTTQCEFWPADLFKQSEATLDRLGHIDKILIDPPRDGALDLVSALGDTAPRRIVYVSCQASTLARDAAVLVHEKGYRLIGTGIANMFPHTSHVESISHFERQ